MSKVTSSGPHVDISTISTPNVILPCASPCNSSSHNHAKSCDELHPLSCCSNNEASPSSRIVVDINHVEEVKELKAQVTSLKKSLKRGQEVKTTLKNMWSGRRPPSDKSGLGF